MQGGGKVESASFSTGKSRCRQAFRRGSLPAWRRFRGMIRRNVKRPASIVSRKTAGDLQQVVGSVRPEGRPRAGGKRVAGIENQLQGIRFFHPAAPSPRITPSWRGAMDSTLTPFF